MGYFKVGMVLAKEWRIQHCGNEHYMKIQYTKMDVTLKGLEAMPQGNFVIFEIVFFSLCYEAVTNSC